MSKTYILTDEEASLVARALFDQWEQATNDSDMDYDEDDLASMRDLACLFHPTHEDGTARTP